MSFTANTEVKTSEVCTKKVEKASVAAVAIGRLSKLKLEIEDHALSGLVLVEKITMKTVAEINSGRPGGT